MIAAIYFFAAFAGVAVPPITELQATPPAVWASEILVAGISVGGVVRTILSNFCGKWL